MLFTFNNAMIRNGHIISAKVYTGYVRVCNSEFIILLVTSYCYGVVSYKASHALRQFSDLLCFPISVPIILDSSTRALRQIPAETPSTKLGETWREMENFADEISLSYSAVFFVMPEKSYDMEPTALRPLRRKARWGFLSPLKTCHPRTCMNPVTFGPVVSTITTRPPTRTS
jgi:hypothetical protein